MALTRASKTEKVSKLASELEHSTSAIIGTFKGLTASKDFELRKAVRGAGGSYHVVKNKLAARASSGTKIEAALQGLKGVSAVAYTSGDPVALAKALSTWVKDNAEFTFKLGIIDGKVISVDEIGDLATMPGKEELFSKLLFLIQSPAQRLATVINATGRDLAVVINQGVEKEKFAGSAAPAASAAEPQAEASAPAPEAAAPAAETPAAETSAVETRTPEAEASTSSVEATPQLEAAHAEESAAGEQPSGAAQPENATASQAGEAAGSDPVEG
ncbi:MAG: 50S ribosomal protein L10 [Acidobacteriota bacterium]|nr:50S ribosomal protein L10 [Acidobacteriota bacterium]